MEYFFWFGYLARLCATLSVSIFALLLMYKLRLSNRISCFLGDISLELYLIHGLLVLVLPAIVSPEQQPYLFVGFLLGGTVLLSWIIHSFRRRFIR